MIDYDFHKADNVNDGMTNLYQIVTYLRDPVDGCPWDKEQTPKDMIRDLQGEVFEYLDALSDGDTEHQKEELGDVFLSLFLLGKIHDQIGDFSLTDCLNDACEKYIRRHPHVFSNAQVGNTDDVLKNWDLIKKNVEGRKEDTSRFFNNIERNMPELERCYKISKKAAKAGFEWKTAEDVADKVREEIDEVFTAKNADEIEDELGDVLFAAVNLCRFLHVKPQDALQRSNAKFIRRFEWVYKKANEQGLEINNLSYEQMNNLWDQAKEVYPE